MVSYGESLINTRHFNQNNWDTGTVLFFLVSKFERLIYTVPACLAIEGGSIEQKKTGSGTSTPASTRWFISWLDPLFSLTLLCARRAAAAAEALDETMVSPVTVWVSTRPYHFILQCMKLKDVKNIKTLEIDKSHFKEALDPIQKIVFGPQMQEKTKEKGETTFCLCSNSFSMSSQGNLFV